LIAASELLKRQLCLCHEANVLLCQGATWQCVLFNKWLCICVLQAWYDYGCFCIRGGSHATALTALQEALVLDLDHTGDTSKPGRTLAQSC
jgi:hypothetical protein